MTIMIRLFQFFLFLVLLVGTYVAMASLFSYFPKASACEGKEQEIYLYHDERFLSHSEIIIPIAPFQKAFIRAFPTLLHHNPRGYLAFSYGDRDFMMDAGGFDDINLTLALRGLFINTPALIKVGHYGGIYKDKCQKIKLSKACLAALKDSILRSFAQTSGQNIRYHDRYGYGDIYYYKAKEPYNLFHTCNTWTGDRLREAGLSMPYWTPLAQNITSQFH